MYDYSQDPFALWIICVAIPFAVGFTWIALAAWRERQSIREQIRSALQSSRSRS